MPSGTARRTARKTLKDVQVAESTVATKKKATPKTTAIKPIQADQWMDELTNRREIDRNKSPTVGVVIEARIPLQGNMSMDDIDDILEEIRGAGAAEVIDYVFLAPE